MYGHVFRHCIYPAYHALKRDGVNPAVRRLRGHDALSAMDLAGLQSRKLARLLRHAYETVPFYRRRLADEGIAGPDVIEAASLATLPPLTKADIREGHSDLISTAFRREWLIPNSTSGSTGEPLEFYSDLPALSHRRAADIRNRSWVGIRLGDREALIWGAAMDKRRASTWRGRIHSALTRRLMLTSYEVSELDFARYQARLKNFRPALLTAYPSVLAEFARFCRERDPAIPGLRAIICSAEVLNETDRATIQETFRVPVLNRYGCREVGAVAVELRPSGGLLVNADRVFVEIVDADGRPCGPGEEGEVLLTDLDSYGMPLIRYAVGDRARWRTGAAGFELPYPVLDSVSGRTLDMINGLAGRRVGGTFWTILLRSRPGIRRFQVVQTEPGSVTVRYVPDGEGADEHFRYFREEIEASLGKGFGVEFRSVQALERNASGKLKLIDNRLSSGDITASGRQVRID